MGKKKKTSILKKQLSLKEVIVLIFIASAISVVVSYASMRVLLAKKEPVKKQPTLTPQAEENLIVSPAPDSTVIIEIETPTNTEQVVQSDRETCYRKIELFENIARSQGYPDDQINSFMELAKFKCDNPDAFPTRSPSERIEDLENEAENREFWESVCSREGKTYDSSVGAGCQ